MALVGVDPADLVIGDPNRGMRLDEPPDALFLVDDGAPPRRDAAPVGESDRQQRGRPANGPLAECPNVSRGKRDVAGGAGDLAVQKARDLLTALDEFLRITSDEAGGRVRRDMPVDDRRVTAAGRSEPGDDELLDLTRWLHPVPTGRDVDAFYRGSGAVVKAARGLARPGQRYPPPAEFFGPDSPDADDAEEILAAIPKRFAADTTIRFIGSRRIFRLEYLYRRTRVVEVGKPEPQTREVVMAILDADPYLVCTPTCGVRRGLPMLVGRTE